MAEGTFREAQQRLGAGAFTEGMRLLQRALQQAKKEKNPSLQAEILARKAAALLVVDQVDPAVSELKRARKLVADKMSPDFASVSELLVDALMRKRDWKRARKVALEALPAVERLGRLNVGMWHHLLGKISMHALSYGDALDHLERARKEYDKDTVEAAEVLDLLATTQVKLGELANSIKTRVSEMELWEVLRGSSSLEYAGAMHRAAIAYSLLKRYEDTVSLLERVVPIREQKLGFDDPLTMAAEKDLKFYRGKMISTPVRRRVSLELEDRPRIDNRPRRFSFQPGTLRSSTVRKKMEQIEAELAKLDEQEKAMEKALDDDINALESAEKAILAGETEDEARNEGDNGSENGSRIMDDNEQDEEEEEPLVL